MDRHSEEADAPASLLLGRRELFAGMLSAVLVYAMLGEARATLAAGPRPVRRWIEDQEEIARALAAGRIRPRDWCIEVERLAAGVDLPELIAALARAETIPAAPPSGNDPHKRFVHFRDESGAPRRLTYGAALFDFSPRNVITPHGHRHMVSAHLVVAGRLRIRNFDRLRDEGQAMVLRPTRDVVAGAGHVSTMCSERDNVHWFVPQGGPARSFDLVIQAFQHSGIRSLEFT